ncbi:hypothetical protein BDZ91DRAFT_739301 [Kalaharituber pfeilii]|nr:hypothetical protein BDZ91DRAFT_739301 [Kalaharituber pfeilii]
MLICFRYDFRTRHYERLFVQQGNLPIIFSYLNSFYYRIVVCFSIIIGQQNIMRSQ